MHLYTKTKIQIQRQTKRQIQRQTKRQIQIQRETQRGGWKGSGVSIAIEANKISSVCCCCTQSILPTFSCIGGKKSLATTSTQCSTKRAQARQGRMLLSCCFSLPICLCCIAMAIQLHCLFDCSHSTVG